MKRSRIYFVWRSKIIVPGRHLVDWQCYPCHFLVRPWDAPTKRVTSSSLRMNYSSKWYFTSMLLPQYSVRNTSSDKPSPQGMNNKYKFFLFPFPFHGRPSHSAKKKNTRFLMPCHVIFMCHIGWPKMPKWRKGTPQSFMPVRKACLHFITFSPHPSNVVNL